MARAQKTAGRRETAPAVTSSGSRGQRIRGSRNLQVASYSCAPLAELTPHGLGVTYWFDTPRDGEPFGVKVRLVGRRLGVRGKPGRRDSFDVEETLPDVVPGSGPVAVTTSVTEIEPGEWQITATARMIRGGRGRDARSAEKLPNGSSTGVTTYAPLVRNTAPGAHLGVWPALVGVGATLALASQFVLTRRNDLPAGRILLLSLVASLVGLIGAKVYYAVEHRGRSRGLLTAGMCIQGFVIGVIGALLVGSAVLDLRPGALVDLTTPGLFFAMAIGRLGCFFGGCCAGRPTGSRWALWSSDRRLGVRRIPTQLLESALATAIGLGSLAIVISPSSDAGGAVFVAALAAYVFGRQVLFPLRSLPRNTRAGRKITMIAAGMAFVAAAIVVLSS